MRMVQVAVDQVVDVIAMRHRFVAAVLPVDMLPAVGVAGMIRRAGIRVGAPHFQPVFVDVPGVHVVQVAVVEVIHMPGVQNAGVTALVAVLVLVFLMDIATHKILLYESEV